MKGIVVGGRGEGKKFMSMEKYKEQFIKNFNINPYPGTLNLEIDEKIYGDMKKLEGIYLHGFIREGKEYGGVKCFPVKILDENCLLIIPEKTVYEKIVEIVSQYNLREKHGLENGDHLEIEFLPFIKECQKMRVVAKPHIGEKIGEITVFYDSPFKKGRRDLCNEKKNGKAYKKTFMRRKVASIIFQGDGKDSYERLLRFVAENEYSVMSPIRRINYSILSEWQIEVKTTKN